MRILTVASEVTPFAKTGGLADVLGALPQALVARGHEVDVVMPRYRGIDAGEAIAAVTVPLGDGPTDVVLRTASAAGVRTVFVDVPALFDRAGLYGEGGRDYDDNPLRFAVLGHAAVQWAAVSGVRYDLVHGHDWQAGALAALIRRPPAPHALAGAPFVFTIHNLAYQGLFDAGWLPRLGLADGLMAADGMEYWRQASYLKAGIVFADVVTTVSPRYAQEIQTAEFGAGFEGILQAHRDRLVGIVNGIDYDRWDPARDPFLPAPFSADDLAGKAAAKRATLAAFGLPQDDAAMRRPLVGMVSRLVDQKGFDLLAGLSGRLGEFDAAFVLLGTGEARYEAAWQSLAAAHPDRVGARIGFDEGLAHLIEGGSDLFLMPSRFEPCGLNQMYSLRYGTVPVVRATGGLADTVRNYDPLRGEGTGFTFDEYSAEALWGTLRWALDTYRDGDAWRGIQRRGMLDDHSWAASAREYEQVFDRARDAATRR